MNWNPLAAVRNAFKAATLNGIHDGLTEALGPNHQATITFTPLLGIAPPVPITDTTPDEMPVTPAPKAKSKGKD